MPQQIGWSTEAKLLYQIKKLLQKAQKAVGSAPATTTTTTTI
jgi:hypothetical protein